MDPEADKRTAILAAAEQMFRERRIHELTMDDVAAAANVSKGTIYRYFKNKDELLFQMATAGFDEICDIVSKTPEAPSFGERLEYLCERLGSFFQERRAVMRMIQEHEGRMSSLCLIMRERWMAHRKKLVDAVGCVLSQGAASGALRVDIAPDTLALLLVGLARTRSVEYDQTPAQRPAAALIVELFLHGAAPAAQPGRDATHTHPERP